MVWAQILYSPLRKLSNIAYGAGLVLESRVQSRVQVSTVRVGSLGHSSISAGQHFLPGPSPLPLPSPHPGPGHAAAAARNTDCNEKRERRSPQSLAAGSSTSSVISISFPQTWSFIVSIIQIYAAGAVQQTGLTFQLQQLCSRAHV